MCFLAGTVVKRLWCSAAKAQPSGYVNNFDLNSLITRYGVGDDVEREARTPGRTAGDLQERAGELQGRLGKHYAGALAGREVGGLQDKVE